MSIIIKKAELYYVRIAKGLTREQKLWFLEEKQHIFNLDLKRIFSDAKNNWLTDGLDVAFDTFSPIGSKDGKGTENQAQGVIFKTYSNGVKTNRDAWAYNFNKSALATNMEKSILFYNMQVVKLQLADNKPKITKNLVDFVDNFVTYDDGNLKWSGDLKLHLISERLATFNFSKIRKSIYRPFVSSYLFFDRV